MVSASNSNSKAVVATHQVGLAARSGHVVFVLRVNNNRRLFAAATAQRHRVERRALESKQCCIVLEAQKATE